MCSHDARGDVRYGLIRLVHERDSVLALYGHVCLRSPLCERASNLQLSIVGRQQLSFSFELLRQILAVSYWDSSVYPRAR